MNTKIKQKNKKGKQQMKDIKQQTTFKKHFRIYFKNGHPAYIIDEEGNMYVFHRVTHSKTSGGRKNLEINILKENII